MLDASHTPVYCGVSRSVSKSLAAHASVLPAAVAAHASVQPLPGASSASLQNAWREALRQHGSMPPLQTDARWTAASAATAAAFPAPDADVERWRLPHSSIPWDVLGAQLQQRGYAQLDDALPSSFVSSARRAARHLLPRLRLLPQDGRSDRSAALRLERPDALCCTLLGGAPSPQPWEVSAYDDAAALASVAALLMSASAALQPFHRCRLAPPQGLQLARYGEGGFYTRHLDNPGREASGAMDGPPGWRSADRALTCLFYLNPEWREEDGGLLRLWAPEGAPPLDVAPRGGTLLLFDSEKVPHEVQPSRAERWALSAWLPRLDAFS